MTVRAGRPAILAGWLCCTVDSRGLHRHGHRDGRTLGGAELDAVLEPLPGAQHDPDTYRWFQTQGDAWAAATEGARPIPAVISDYVSWIKGLGIPTIFASCPLAFDGLWISMTSPQQSCHRSGSETFRKPIGRSTTPAATHTSCESCTARSAPDSPRNGADVSCFASSVLQRGPASSGRVR